MESAAMFERRLYDPRLAERIVNQQQKGAIMHTRADVKTTSNKTHSGSAPILFSVGLYGLRVDLRARNVGKPPADRALLFERCQ